MSWLFAPSKCENCGDKPKRPGHNYCSKPCADEAEAKRRSVADAKFKAATGYGGKAGGNPIDEDDNLCEECHARPKNKQRDLFTGNIIVHAFCGRSCKDNNTRRRAEAARQMQMQRQQQAMNNGASAQTVGMREPLNLRRFDPKDPMGRTVHLRFMEAWKAEGVKPKVEAIFRIMMPQKYNIRFIDTLDSNEGCQTQATYYGGQCLCDVGTDPNEFPAPCDWKGCSICVVMKLGFEKIEFGETAYDGLYGRGIYTHQDSSHAHTFTIGKSTSPFRAVIQCRVAYYDTHNGHAPEGTCTAMIDESGRVFCDSNSKSAIIPTHLIIYGPPDERPGSN